MANKHLHCWELGTGHTCKPKCCLTSCPDAHVPKGEGVCTCASFFTVRGKHKPDCDFAPSEGVKECPQCEHGIHAVKCHNKPESHICGNECFDSVPTLAVCTCQDQRLGIHASYCPFYEERTREPSPRRVSNNYG